MVPLKQHSGRDAELCSSRNSCYCYYIQASHLHLMFLAFSLTLFFEQGSRAHALNHQMCLDRRIGLKARHRIITQIPTPHSKKSIILVVVLVLPPLFAAAQAGQYYLMTGPPKSNVTHEAVIERLEYFWAQWPSHKCPHRQPYPSWAVVSQFSSMSSFFSDDLQDACSLGPEYFYQRMKLRLFKRAFKNESGGTLYYSVQNVALYSPIVEG